jgi:hypothetical protein
MFAVLLATTVLCSVAPAKPNIVYILADDMGYADAGFNGCKEIKTPNLDKLAHAGAILKSFYVQPVCSPTRASLMTGRYVAQKRFREDLYYRLNVVRIHLPPLRERCDDIAVLVDYFLRKTRIKRVSPDVLAILQKHDLVCAGAEGCETEGHSGDGA